jgi:hypothetical protein
MPNREFEIVVAPDGQVELKVSGFQGKRCLEAMEVFRQIVGEVGSQQPTHEFYAPEEDVRIHIERQH